MKKRFRDYSIKNKMIYIFVVFMILPLLISSILLYLRFTETSVQKKHMSVIQTLDLLQKHTELKLHEYERKSMEFYKNEDTFEIIGDSGRLLSDLELLNIQRTLKRLQSSQKYIDSIYFFHPNGQIIYSDYFGYGRFGVMYKENITWEKEIRAMDGKVCWFPSFEFPMAMGKKIKIYNFSYGRIVKDIYSRFQDKGVIIINIDTKMLDEICRSVEVSQNGLIVITDENGNVVWHENEDWIGGDLSTYDFFSNTNNDSRNIFEDYINGEEYFIIHKHSPFNNWKYIAFVPKDDILDEIKPLTVYFILIVFVCVTLYIFGAFIIDKYISTPIQKMIVAMDHMKRGDMNIELERHTGDEIGVLYKSFNDMNMETRKLINKINYMNKKEREHELRALQAQINPHFLYNTLDTINWIAVDKEQVEISDMLMALSHILRYSISRSHYDTTIEDELLWVENYIFIQRTRFEDKFTIDYEIDERILQYKAFRLMLQPFVENAINHAFQEFTNEGQIIIKGYMKERDIYIEIIDNGCGMPQTKIQEILSGLGEGIGIYNIHQCIKLSCGKQYGVSIYSRVGEGTRVVVKIPAMT